MTLPTSPSYNAARAEIAAAIVEGLNAWNTAHGYLPAQETENRYLVDLASPDAARPFITWEMKFRGGGQAALGNTPLARQLGQIVLATKVKEGMGTAQSLALLDHLIPYIEAKDFPITSTEMATVEDGFPRQGWYFIPCVINFWIDRIAV